MHRKKAKRSAWRVATALILFDELRTGINQNSKNQDGGFIRLKVLRVTKLNTFETDITLLAYVKLTAEINVKNNLTTL